MGPEDLELSPDKRYFKIGEVSDLTGLKAYVLRFWESEFSEIKPSRTLSGQRIYRKADVELILTIKHLLYDKKFTIPGAKDYLKKQKNPVEETRQDQPLTRADIIRELKSIRALLD